jgi:hypothetical protein
VKDVATVLRPIFEESGTRKRVVKLDAEGAEFEIVNRLYEAGLLAKIDLLLMEWHTRPDKTLEDLRRPLRQAGFAWTERDNQSSPIGLFAAFQTARGRPAQWFKSSSC